MIAPKEIKLTYRKCTIRIVKQPDLLVVYWQSPLDGSEGHLQVPISNWADGELVRLVMQTIDCCCNKHDQMQNQRQVK